MENSTPMIKQYKQIKSNYKEHILFFRLGDFYEMFFEDAKIASQILDVVLTSRSSGKNMRIPMCGIPYHAAENYIAKLIKHGLKVAICEQIEDPKTTKGLVKRKVVKVITPGTFIPEDSQQKNLLGSVQIEKDHLLIALLDISQGTIKLASFPRDHAIEEIIALEIKEIIYPENDKEIIQLLSQPIITNRITLTPQPNWKFNLELAREEMPPNLPLSYITQLNLPENIISNIYSVVSYAQDTIGENLTHIDKVQLLRNKENMFLQPSAVIGLGLDELIKSLNDAKTPMGRRTLKEWLKNPLINQKVILMRQEAIGNIMNNLDSFSQIAKQLAMITDIERNLSRIACGYQKPKDLINLRNNLVRARQIQQDFDQILSSHPFFQLQIPNHITKLLERALVEALPQKIEGNLIQNGFCEEIDRLKNIQKNAKDRLKQFQVQEIKRTGIQSLKVGYNKIFGYYIEVTKANLQHIPKNYIRKQTLVNAERFITEELKEFEREMLYSEQRLLEKEKEIISYLRKEIIKESKGIYKLASQIGTLDSLINLSLIAKNRNYIIPKITDDFIIDIKQSRHPIIELNCNEFIPNDLSISKANNFLIITGPNMAGKSTFIRQIGLIIIMAQSGCPVPASSCTIGLVDRLFARIGAQDEIFQGQSTFMVEMSQTAAILNNITERSLVILDEIGRGTSTYDGLSIAWAVSEFLAQKNIRTLFATHFHELTRLAEQFSNIKNYNVEVKEWNGEVIFLHRITEGSCDQSYGIHVAKIAGIPQGIIARAKDILQILENTTSNSLSFQQPTREYQLPLFLDNKEQIIHELKNLDINQLTGLEALNKINQWKKTIE